MLTCIYVVKESNIFFSCYMDLPISITRSWEIKRPWLKKKNSQLLGSFSEWFDVTFIFIARQLHYISVSIYELHNVN